MPGQVQKRFGLLDCVAAVVAVLCASAWFHPPVVGEDLWWHLAAGREVAARGGPPLVDVFSFTAAGRPWLNPEWLWDAAAWQLYARDPQVLAWANLAVLFVLFAVAWETCRATSGSRLAASLAVVAAAATSHLFFDIRPHVATMLFVAVLLLLRDARAAPWLWPPLVALWANVHGGFVFGIAMVGLLVTTRTLTGSLAVGRLVVRRREWVALALCLVAWTLNPWGTALIRFPLDLLDAASPYREVREWLPPELSADPRLYGGRFLWLAAAAAVAVPLLVRRDLFLVLLNLVTFSMALSARRFIPLFAITAAPLAATAAAWPQRQAERRWPLLTAPAAAAGATVAGVLVTALLLAQVRLRPRLFERWVGIDYFPREAVRYLNALGPPVRLLNTNTWGGFIMIHAPQSRLFFDGRGGTVYPDEIALEHAAILRGGPDLPARLARHRIDAALLGTGSRLATNLTRLPQPWAIVYQDATAVILLPPDSPLLRAPLPTPEQVLGPGWESCYLRVARALRDEDRATAIRELEAVVAADPLRTSVWGHLAILHGLDRDVEAVRTTIAAAIHADPRSRVSFRLAEAEAYLQAGDKRRAIGAYRDLRWYDTGNLAGFRERLAELEREQHS
jgi:hypothetical protein